MINAYISNGKLLLTAHAERLENLLDELEREDTLEVTTELRSPCG
ncbi:hypothetical protein [Archaeoglobus neptunius]|nr:hypothetical protein [Archaeoglobus neptunius]